MTPKSESEWEKVQSHLAFQYGKHLMNGADILGNLEQVFEDLKDRIIFNIRS